MSNSFASKVDSSGRVLTATSAEEASRIDEPSSSITYLGYARQGAATSQPIWKIKKIEVVGTETIVSYAGDGKQHNQIWDDRAILTY